mgnify:CR=1 FL=1
MTILSYIVAVTSAMCLHCQKGLPGIGRKCPVHCVPECWCRCSGTGGYGGQIQVFWTGKFHKTQVFWTGKFHKIQVFWTGKYHCWEIIHVCWCIRTIWHWILVYQGAERCTALQKEVFNTTTSNLFWFNEGRPHKNTVHWVYDLKSILKVPWCISIKEIPWQQSILHVSNIEAFSLNSWTFSKCKWILYCQSHPFSILKKNPWLVNQQILNVMTDTL